MKTTKHDDGLEWLHDIRARLAKQFDYNPRKAAVHYRRIQKASGAKLYQRDVPAAAGIQSADALHETTHTETAISQPTSPTSYRATRKRKPKAVK